MYVVQARITSKAPLTTLYGLRRAGCLRACQDTAGCLTAEHNNDNAPICNLYDTNWYSKLPYYTWAADTCCDIFFINYGGYL